MVLLPRLGLGLIVLEIALASRVSVHVVRWEFLGMLVLFHVRCPQCLYILVLLDCGRNFCYSGALVSGESLVICHCADPLGLGLLRRDLMNVMVASGCHDPGTVTLDTDRLRLHWLHHVAQTDCISRLVGAGGLIFYPRREQLGIGGLFEPDLFHSRLVST